MSVFGRIARIIRGRSSGGAADLGRSSGAPRSIRARYDAAQTSPSNVNHWAWADGLSADAAANPGTRKQLRERSRYEVANNSYARAAVNQIAIDTIGDGPRLQLLTPNEQANERIEAAFAAWARLIQLPEKLRMMRVARAESGEVFSAFTTNPRIAFPVQLDVKLIEADQIASPFLDQSDPSRVDGIRFDAAGNPIEYDVLNQHPGDSYAFTGGLESTPVPASEIIHYFKRERPGQSRGIPEITSALGLFAQLRRFTLATLEAAEQAANIALVAYTDSPALNPDDLADVDPLDEVDLKRGTMTTLPAGWKLGQPDIAQPQETMPAFVRLLLTEIGRSLNIPVNVLMGDSSEHNFAAARLDHLIYDHGIRTDRSQIEAVILDRMLSEFLFEAVRIPGFIPISMRNLLGSVQLPPHVWFWPNRAPVELNKNAAATKIELESGTTTLADVYAEKGQDWIEATRQRAREKQLLDELGLSPAEAAPAGDGDDETNSEADE